MRKLTPHQQKALDVHTRRTRIAKWWGTQRGYYGKKGGWIYNSKDWVVVQGWDNFYHRYKLEIWEEIGGEEELVARKERTLGRGVCKNCGCLRTLHGMFGRCVGGATQWEMSA